MKIYRLNCLLSSNLNKEEIQKSALAIESLIQKEGGILVSERTERKVDLGSEIEKENKAIMLNLRFQIDPQKLTTLNQELKKVSGTLRFAILAQKKPKQALSKKVEKAKREGSEKKKKVELKEIEQQLNKILDES